MTQQVAVFWDFQNLHQRVLLRDHGAIPEGRGGLRDQPGVVDLAGLQHFISEQEPTAAQFAYANWQHLSIYAHGLQKSGIRLVQSFQDSSGAGASSRELLMQDMVATATGPAAPAKIVLVGGDGEYVSAIDHIKEKSDCTFWGVNIHLSGDEEWEGACDRFFPYEDLTRPLRGNAPNAAVRETHAALEQVVYDLSVRYGEQWVQQVRIKPALLKELPGFDERDYGYPSLGSYLEDQRDLLQRRRGSQRYEPEYRLLPAIMLARRANDAPGDVQLLDDIALYTRIATQQGLRMPRPAIMWVGIDIYSAFLHDEDHFPSFSALDEECLRQLVQEFPDASMTDAKKVRQILFKCYIFSPSSGDSILFQEEIQTLADIEDRFFELVLQRVAANAPRPINWRALSCAFTNEEQYADRIEELFQVLK